jgi:hypothetical protein
VAVKEPLVWFAGIVMPFGTVTTPLLLDNATVAPPAGAAAERVTMQMELPGAFTVPGEQLSPLGTVTVAFRLTEVDWLSPFSAAVTVAVWLLPTFPAVAVNAALPWPAGMVTLSGTVNKALPLVRATAAETAVALLSDTVQVVLALL